MKRRSWASMVRPCCAGCFCNVRKRAQLTLRVNDPLDGHDPEGADQLVLQVCVAHVEAEPLHVGPGEVGPEAGSLETALKSRSSAAS